MADQPKRVTGGCLCGAVRFEARVFLKSAYICHCSICRKSTGQPAEISVPIVAGTLEFVSGTPRWYVSSKIGRRAFCGACGSRLAWQTLERDDDWLSSVDVGSLDHPEEVRAECHIFVDTQLPWYDPSPSLPRFREAEGDALLARWREQRPTAEAGDEPAVGGGGDAGEASDRAGL